MPTGLYVRQNKIDDGLSRYERWRSRHRTTSKCSYCGEVFSYAINIKDRKYCGKKCQHKSLVGRKEDPEHIKLRLSRMSPIRKKYEIKVINKGWVNTGKKGEDSPAWKGGVTPINEKIRKSKEYKSWRESIFLRDNFTCVLCGERGCELNADHIKPFSLYPELRLDLDNGRTLCVQCHKQTDTFMGRARWNYVSN